MNNVRKTVDSYGLVLYCSLRHTIIKVRDPSVPLTAKTGDQHSCETLVR